MSAESDDDFRQRILDAYGMWGAFASIVVESSGSALDDVGKSMGLTRSRLDKPQHVHCFDGVIAAHGHHARCCNCAEESVPYENCGCPECQKEREK